MTTSTDRTVAVLLFEGCTIAEVIPAATRLANHGYTLSYVGLTPVITDQSGLAMNCDRVLTEADIGTDPKPDVLLIPGGDPGSIMGNDTVRAYVQSCGSNASHSSSTLCAGICAAVLVLADAGLLDERKVTHNYRSPWAPAQVENHVAHLFQTCRVEPDTAVGVVHDENIVTALPNATAEFAVTIETALGLQSPDRTQLLTRHLQGQYVPELFEPH